MPTGIADAPRRVPLQFLILKLGFGKPQCEIRLVALVVVRLHALPDADGEILLGKIMEHMVLFRLGGVKINISAGDIRISLFQQDGNHPDIVVNAPGCRLNHIRAADIQLPAVLKKGIGVILGDLHDRLMFPARAFQHFIFTRIGIAGQVSDVGDIHHPLDLISGVAQIPIQNVLHDIGAQISDVRIVVHGGSAGIHTDFSRFVRDQFFPLV